MDQGINYICDSCKGMFPDSVDIHHCVISDTSYCTKCYIKKLRAERDELKAIARRAIEMLSKCTRDMFQTVRANQSNLDGRDPIFPDDAPATSRIGKHIIHQQGIDVTMRIINEARKFMGEAAEAAKEKRKYDLLDDDDDFVPGYDGPDVLEEGDK